MSLLKWLFSPRAYFNGPGAVGILFLRVVFGLGLMFHGSGKIQDPFHWMGPQGPPGFLQALAAISEFFGGMALACGVLTPLACFGIMCTMFVAILAHETGGKGPVYFIKPMDAPKDASTYEPALGYFVVALCVFLRGPGLLSFDAFAAKALFGRKTAQPTATELREM